MTDVHASSVRSLKQQLWRSTLLRSLGSNTLFMRARLLSRSTGAFPKPQNTVLRDGGLTSPSFHHLLPHCSYRLEQHSHCSRRHYCPRDVEHTHVSEISQFMSGMCFGLFLKGRYSCLRMNSIFFSRFPFIIL